MLEHVCWSHTLVQSALDEITEPHQHEAVRHLRDSGG